MMMKRRGPMMIAPPRVRIASHESLGAER